MKRSSQVKANRRTVYCLAAGVALALLLLQACSTPAESPDKSAAGLVACEAPRPEICTREYRPVCAHVDAGIRCVTTPCPSERHETYGNACSACANNKVIAYEQGTCESYGK